MWLACEEYSPAGALYRMPGNGATARNLSGLLDAQDTSRCGRQGADSCS